MESINYGTEFKKFLTSIAEAIRSVKNTTEKIPAQAFAAEILNLNRSTPSVVRTQEEIDNLATGTVFVYMGDPGTYEVGSYYLVESIPETITIMLGAANVSGNDFSSCYIKFGDAPTSSDDYDYYANAGGQLRGKDESYYSEPQSFDVAPIAYLWQTAVDAYGGYKLNESSNIIVGKGYQNATAISLDTNDRITLLYTFD